MTVKQDEAKRHEAPLIFRAPLEIFRGYLRRSISIFYVVDLLLAGKYLIIAAALAGMFYGAYTVNQNGPHYTATIRVSPAETDNPLGGGGGAGGLLAGLTGGGNSAVLPKFTQFMLTTSSAGVAQELDRKYDMVCRIFAGECDLATHQWKERTGIREIFNALIASLSGLPNPNGPRTIDDLAMYVSGAVGSEVNKNNSMVEFRYTSPDPKFAAQFLAAVIKSTNDYVRAQSRETQRRYVEYLSNSAGKTVNVEQRTAIDNLLLQEERQLMMTEVDVPYAAKVLDGPIVKPVNDALKTIALKAILGLVLGAIVVVCRDLLPRKWLFW
jgi:hypothetical protein